MPGEVLGPVGADGTPPHDGRSEETPLNLKDNAERLPLLEELSAVLQNVLALRYPHASAAERAAVKAAIDSDTTEIVLPKVVSKPRRATEDDEVPPRVKARRAEERKERTVREMMKRHGRDR